MPDNLKQHIVPRFHIAFFNADGQNVFIRKKGSTSVFSKSPTSQGYERDAFTVMNEGIRDTSYDNANKAVEDYCAPHLARLTASSPPSRDQWQAIFVLTANLICRSRWTRDHIVWGLERVQNVLPKFIEVAKELPPLPEAIRHLGPSPGELDESPSVLKRAAEVLYPLSAALGTEPVAVELKTGKDCDLLVAPSGSTFIFSDEPTLILDSGKPVTMTLRPGFLACSEVEVYMPIKPDLACFWSSKSIRVTRTITPNKVALYNRLIWENCYERAFASRRSDLEQL